MLKKIPPAIVGEIVFVLIVLIFAGQSIFLNYIISCRARQEQIPTHQCELP